MTDSITTTTDADFDSEVLRSALPVLVDFWDEWCGPCKAMAPMLEQFAADCANRVKVVTVEMDKNQRTAIAWRVRSAPTLLLFHRGAVHATHVDMASRSQLTAFVAAVL